MISINQNQRAQMQSFQGKSSKLLLKKAKNVAYESQNLFIKYPNKNIAAKALKESIESYKQTWLQLVLAKTKISAERKSKLLAVPYSQVWKNATLSERFQILYAGVLTK
ncbi:hypothetical protein IJD34_08220 [bacterium]|nr:hypothetical protein [bacterium]